MTGRDSRATAARRCAAVAEDDVAGGLAKIAAPTLIIWGDQDAIAPLSDQETLAAAVLDARLVVYPGAGHGFHWEAPHHFASDLAAFVEEIGSWKGNRPWMTVASTISPAPSRAPVHDARSSRV